MAKKIALTYEVTTGKTAKELAEVELRLNDISKALRQAKKDADGKTYAKLRAEQIDLQEEGRRLRKEVRDQSKAFKDADFPADSLIGLRQEYKRLRKEVNALSSDQRNSDFGQNLIEEARRVKQQIDDIGASVGDFRSNVGNYQNAVENALNATGGLLGGNFSAVLAGFGAGGAIVAGLDFLQQGVSAATELTNQFIELRGQVQQLTGASGTQLDSFTTQIKAIADTFDQDYNEVLRAANTLTDQLTGDFDQSLELIRTGFLSGANASNEFLDNLREYPAFFNEAQLSGEQLISVLTQSVEQGVFSDKGVDLIKEFTIRIRELTPATVAALEGIGLTSERIAQEINERGIGAAFTLVQERLGTLRDDSPVVGRALADIFGGPGEDAGIQFIKNLDLTQQGIENLIDPTNELVRRQQIQLELNQQLAEAQRNLAAQFGESTLSLEILGQRLQIAVVETGAEAVRVFKLFFNAIRPVFDALVRLGQATGILNEDLESNRQLVDQIAKFYGFVFTAISKVIDLVTKFVGVLRTAGEQIERVLTAPVRLGRNLLGLSKAQEEVVETSEQVNTQQEKTQEQTKKTADETKKLTEEYKQLEDTTKKLAAGSLAFLEDRVRTLQEELRGVTNAADFAKLSEQLEAAEAKLRETEVKFRNATSLTTALLNTSANIGSPGGPQTSEGAIQSILDQLTLEQEARAAIEKDTQEILNRIRRKGQEDYAAIRKEQRDSIAEEEREIWEQQSKIIGQSLESIGVSLGEFFASTDKDFKELAKQLFNTFLTLIENQILGTIALALSNEVSQKGFLGLVTGPILAGVIKGFFSAFRSQIKGFAGGGIVDGGEPIRRSNGDDVLITAKRGEVILNRRQQAAAAALGGPDFFSRIGVPGFNTGGIVQPIPQIIQPNSVLAQQGAIQGGGVDNDTLDQLAEKIAVQTGTAVMAGIMEAERRRERQINLRKDKVQ